MTVLCESLQSLGNQQQESAGRSGAPVNLTLLCETMFCLNMWKSKSVSNRWTGKLQSGSIAFVCLFFLTIINFLFFYF